MKTTNISPESSEFAAQVLRELILSESVEAEPETSLADELSCMPLDSLRDMARAAKVHGGISRMKKATLVKKIADIMRSSTTELLITARRYGAGYLRGLRRLMAAGGRLDVPISQVQALDDIVRPVIPLSTLYYWNETLTCIMPQEVMEALRDVDWEDEIARVEPIDRAIDFFDLAVDLRGIVLFDDVYAEWRAREPNAPSREDVETAILYGTTGAQTAFKPILLSNKQCLVHSKLEDDLRPYEDDEIDFALDDEFDSELEIFRYDQEELPARNVPDELVAAGSVLHWILDCPAAQRLLSFLSEHAPEDIGIDKSLFASAMTSLALMEGRHTQSVAEFCASLNELGFSPAKEDIDEFIGLYSTFMAHVPKWYLNGWSAYDQITGAVDLAEKDDPRHSDSHSAAPASEGEASLFSLLTNDTLSPSAGTSSQEADLFSFDPFGAGASSERSYGIETNSAAPGRQDIQSAPEPQSAPDGQDGPDPQDEQGQDPIDSDEYESVDVFDYENYERLCAELKEKNEHYLEEFDKWLTAKGLSDKTISRHIGNVDFFLNHFLHYYDATPMEYGCGRIDDFLGDWFIRKAMWSTPATVRQTATSLKKFYTCMFEKGHIGRRELDYVIATIKEGTPLWAEACERYNTGDLDEPWLFDD